MVFRSTSRIFRSFISSSRELIAIHKPLYDGNSRRRTHMCPHPSESSLREDLCSFLFPSEPTWSGPRYLAGLLLYHSPPHSLILTHNGLPTPWTQIAMFSLTASYCSWYLLVLGTSWLLNSSLDPRSWRCQPFLTQVSVQMSPLKIPLLEVVLPLRTTSKGDVELHLFGGIREPPKQWGVTVLRKKGGPGVSLASGTTCPQWLLQILQVEAESLKQWASFSAHQETLGFIILFIYGTWKTNKKQNQIYKDREQTDGWQRGRRAREGLATWAKGDGKTQASCWMNKS